MSQPSEAESRTGGRMVPMASEVELAEAWLIWGGGGAMRALDSFLVTLSLRTPRSAFSDSSAALSKRCFSCLLSEVEGEGICGSNFHCFLGARNAEQSYGQGLFPRIECARDSSGLRRSSPDLGKQRRPFSPSDPEASKCTQSRYNGIP